MVNNVLIPCKTLEDSKSFFKAAKEFGIKWLFGEIDECDTDWNKYKEETVYHIAYNKLFLSNKEYFLNNGDRNTQYKVYTVDEFINKTKGTKIMTVTDLKPGMLLKFKNRLLNKFYYGLVEEWLFGGITITTEEGKKINPKEMIFLDWHFDRVIEIYSEAHNLNNIDKYSTEDRDLIWKELIF